MNKSVLAQRALILIYMAIITPVVMIALLALHTVKRFWENRFVLFEIWIDVKEDWQKIAELWAEAWISQPVLQPEEGIE